MTLNIFISAFGWALIHSLWQAAIIFLALHLSLRIFRHAPSHIKYVLAYSAMAGIFLCFLFTFYRLWNNQQSMEHIAAATTAGWIPAETIKSYASLQKSSEFNLLQPAMWIDYFVLLYGAGLIFFAGKIVRDFLAMRHIRNTRIKPFDKAWEHYLDKLRIAWKIPKQVKLFLSEYIDVPVVIGYLKPVIYLPVITATNLSPEQIEAILLHELAHIKRYDFIANIFQTLIETILFFNPFVWMISKIIRKERENSCDDLVLSALQPALYAETLLALAENQLYKGNFVLAATGKKQQLFQRIKRIMEMKTKKLNIMQKLLVLFILAVGVISVSWLIPEKKSAHQRATKVAIIKMAPHFYPNQKADTNLLPAPPVPPLTTPATPPSPTSVPAPPTAPTSMPAPPVAIAASVDSIPYNFLNDSAIHSMQHRMQQYFKSEAWQKYQQDLQSYQQHIQQYFQSKEWKKQQRQIQKQSMQISKMALLVLDTSSQWKGYVNALKAEANKMSEMFNNPKWKASMDSLRQQIGKERINMDSLMRKNKIKFSFDRAKMDSLMMNARKEVALARMHHPNMFLFSNGYTVNPNEIVQMMEQDGLIKNDNNFSIKINEKGLYINGKKQGHVYFEKYRNLIGQHTKLEIRKKGGHLESSINTEENDNKISM